MTNYGAFFVVALIIAALVISLAITQGQTNNVTVVTNVTTTNGVTLPADNVTPGTFDGSYNLTGNLTLNTAETCLMSPTGLSHICINEAAGTHVGYGDGMDTHTLYTYFAIQQIVNNTERGRWDDSGLNVTNGNVTLTNGSYFCLNENCSKFITTTDGYIIINNTG